MSNEAIYYLAMSYKAAKDSADKYLGALSTKNQKIATSLIIECGGAFVDAVISTEDKQRHIAYTKEQCDITAYLITEFAVCDILEEISEFEKKSYSNAVIMDVQPRINEFHKHIEAALILTEEIDLRKECIGKPTLMYMERLTKCVEALLLYKAGVLDNEGLIQERSLTLNEDRKTQKRRERNSLIMWVVGIAVGIATLATTIVGIILNR